MSTGGQPEGTGASPAPRPRLAEATAVALIAVVVAGAALGVARYVEAREYNLSVQTDVDQAAARIAGRVAAGEPIEAAGLDELLGGKGRVAVVASGGTDEFGIARGTEVSSDIVTDVRLELSAEEREVSHQGLLDQSAEIESYVEEGREIPRDARLAFVDRDDGLAAAVVAPVLDKAGAYQGMVSVARIVPQFSPTTTIWMVLLGFLLAFGATVGILRTRAVANTLIIPGAPRETRKMPLRVVGGLVAALPAALPVIGFSGTLAAYSAGIAFVLGFISTPGLTAFCRGLREQPGTYVYVAPAVLALLVLVFLPFFMGTAIAFFDAEGNFIGVQQFVDVLSPSETSETNFYWTLFITILWTVTNVILHVSIGMALAMVLNRPNLRFKGIYRVLLIVPWAVPNYITALIWKMMFNTQQGAVNAFLALFGVDKIDWLGQSVETNFIANLVTNTWLGFPFMMVVTLGALQSIPKDLYEAAEIDGAGRWQRFRHVTLPLLKPALIPAIILGSIWTFNMFNVIYLVSGGAPDGQTNILITEAYHAFKVLQQYGFAAAYSVIIFLILYAYGKLTDRISKAAEGVYG